MPQATRTYENLILEVSEGVAIVTVNRPPANPLSKATLEELQAALDPLGPDPGVKAVVITGAGQHVFIGGADINEFVELDAHSVEESVKRGHAVVDTIEHYPKPVVAAVNGACLGGGNELAMACHIRIAAESAIFGQPEVGLGIIPAWGATQRLPRLVGRGRAFELLLTGDRIKADDAFRIGLVNKVVPDNELLATARNLGRKLATLAPVALRTVIECVNGDLSELDGVTRIFRTNDAKEGITAFLTKRRPKFTGS